MPFDQGNKWVIEAPNGDIIHDWANKDKGLKQNDAIRGANALNSGEMTESDFSKT
jgi:Ni,Fe-hydrogenase III large subunit